jgi:sugar-specific transcriptional regulator TrmB
MISELEQLGMSNYESKIISVLAVEKCEIKDLSRKAKVPFGKIYSVIKSLKEKGVVKESESHPKLVYIENTSELIGRLIDEKKKLETVSFERLRDFVMSIEKSESKQSKFFEIGTTVEENRRIQLRSFVEAEKEVLQVLSIHHKPKSNRESKTLWEKEIEKAVKKGVSFKCIYPKHAVLPDILAKLNKNKANQFQVKRFDTDFVRCDIIDKKKVLIKLVHQDPLQFGGVLFIENERLAENLSKIFHEFWEHAE